MSLISLAYGLERPSLAEIGQLNDQNSPLETPTIRESTIHKGAPIQALPLNTAIQTNTPWLGVLGEPVSETLKLHLGINNGLVLRQVAPSSPASQAGLKPHDIIKSINGSEIISQQKLKEVIYDLAPGDIAKISIYSKGGRRDLQVELSEKPPEPISSKSGVRKNYDFFKQFFDKTSSFFDEPFSPLGVGDPFSGMFENLLNESTTNKRYDVDFQSTGSIQIVDDYGSVEIKTVNDEKYVIVKNLDGGIAYEGSWGNPQSKENVPEHIKNRIESIDFNYQNQSLHLSPKIRNKTK